VTVSINTNTSNGKPARRRRVRNRKGRSRVNQLQSSAPASVPNGPRTTMSVENSLRRLTLSNSGNQKASSWGMCRLNPWNASSMMNMARLPDGNSANGYSYDLYSFADVTLSSSNNITFTTFPGLPFQAMLTFPSGASTVTISGANSQGVSAPAAAGGLGFYNYTGPAATGATVPICYGRFPVDDNPFTANPASYGATKARIISQAWRLTYTGPASTCSGIVTVTPTPLGMDPEEPMNKGLGRINYQNLAGVAATSSTDCALTPVLIQQMSYVIPSANKESKQMRPETTPTGLVRRSAASTDWNFRDVAAQSLILTQPIGAGATLGGGSLNAYFAAAFSQPAAGGSTATLGSVDFLDNQWESTSVVLTGVTGSFRFETITCFEFIAQTSSIQYDLSTPSPPLNTKALQGVESAAHARLAYPSSM